MPEISTFLDRDDERSLVELVLAQGGQLVAVLHPSSQYRTIKQWDDYVAARTDTQLFFLIFTSYYECPLKLKLLNRGLYAGKYYVMQRVGGPTISWLTSVQYHKDGMDWISDGGLSYYPTYQSTITGEMEKPLEALVKQYKQLVSHLKKGARLIRGQSGRRYYIGPHTRGLIEQGKMQIGVKELNL